MITQDRLKEVLNYDPVTGIFTWRVTKGKRVPKGSVAGCLNDRGYRIITIDGKLYKAHRLVFLYVDGYWPENQVDHINRARTDNHRANLREASQQCQSRNYGALKSNISKIKGVHSHSLAKKWHALIMVNGKNKHLGYYDTILDAAYARFAAEQCLGFQDWDLSSSALQFIQKAQTKTPLSQLHHRPRGVSF